MWKKKTRENKFFLNINHSKNAFATEQARRLLPAERAALGQTGLATGGLAEHGRAAGADDDGLGVGEDGGDGEAAGALDVHEEGSRSWDEVLEKVNVSSKARFIVITVPPYLQLVLTRFGRRRRVEEIDSEDHFA